MEEKLKPDFLLSGLKEVNLLTPSCPLCCHLVSNIEMFYVDKADSGFVIYKHMN